MFQRACGWPMGIGLVTPAINTDTKALARPLTSVKSSLNKAQSADTRTEITHSLLNAFVPLYLAITP